MGGGGAWQTGESSCGVQASARRQNRRQQRWLGVGACLLLALCSLVAGASPAGTARLRDYVIDSLSSRTGLPHNSLRDIAQTRDGYLWFATWEGLVRYNGLEFNVIDRSTRPGLPDNGVGALYVDRDGALWLSDARGNLVRHGADGQWRQGQRQGQWPQALIHAMTMDAEGRMWLLFEGHGLGCLWADGRFDYFPPHDDAPRQSSFPRMVFDARGRLLIGTFDGLIYREPDGRMHRAPAAFGFSPGLAWPYRATDGAVWVVAGDQLYRLQGERAELVHRVPGQGHFTAMLQGRHGDLWLGSENQGLLRIGPYGVEHLPAGRSLPTGRIVSLREDAEGSIWVGANGGLWIAGTAGLDRMLPDGRIVPVSVVTPSGRRLSVLSLALDRRGDLWVGTYADGVFVLRDGRVLRHYGEAEGIPGGHIRAIVIGDHDAVWLATQRGVVQLVDRKRAPLAIAGLPGQRGDRIGQRRWRVVDRFGRWCGSATQRQAVPVESGAAGRRAQRVRVSGHRRCHVDCDRSWSVSRAQWRSRPLRSGAGYAGRHGVPACRRPALAMRGSAAIAACCAPNSRRSMQLPMGAARSRSNALARSMAWAMRRPTAVPAPACCGVPTARCGWRQLAA